MEGSGEARLLEILTSVKALAKEYYDLTGRPLGVTGEMAEFEAHRRLQVELTPVRQPGYDAIERVGGEVRRLQIKGRCLQPNRDRSPRVGRIDVEHEWDRLLMVLMDQNFDATEIVEATRASVQEELERPGSKARNERHSLSVSKVRTIGLQRWPPKPG